MHLFRTAVLCSLLAFSASAQPTDQAFFNLLESTDFENSMPGSFPDWDLYSADGVTYFSSTWPDPSISRYLNVRLPTPGELGDVIVASQCIRDVQPGENYLLGGDVSNIALQSNWIDQSRTLLGVTWSSDDDCADALAMDKLRNPDFGLDWLALNGSAVAPAAARSALFFLAVENLSVFDGAGGRFDNLYFGLETPPLCAPSDKTLCVSERFAVTLDYETSLAGGTAGRGMAVDLSSVGINEGGLFWMFSASNPEVLIKVLDACDVFGNFWVFVSAGTNVGFEIRIVDGLHGREWTTSNPDLVAFESVQDLEAFPCDAP